MHRNECHFISEESTPLKFGNDYFETKNNPRIATNQIKFQYYANGRKEYAGQMENGTKHGNGILLYPNGNVAYLGHFNKGVMNGTGKLYYNDNSSSILFDGSLMDGEIKDGIVYAQTGNVIRRKHLKV